MKTEIIEKKNLILSIEDIKKLLPDEDFKYTMYRNYDDEIDQDTLIKAMPDFDFKMKNQDWTDYYYYKNDDWSYNYPMIVWERKNNLENTIRERNIDYITDGIDRELREKVKEKLKEKGIEYDYFEFDFYPDDLYSIDLDLDYILKRSRVYRNVIRKNNYDWFYEGETYEDWEGLKELVDLYPELVTKEQLETAVNDGMYTWSDLKVNFCHNMKDFFDILESWWIDLTGCTAVLHLSINWSWSSDFELWKWRIEFDKQVWKTQYDRRDRWFDWRYWVRDVYGCTMNNCY